MLERIVSFIERIVVALETIAKAPAVCAGTQPPPPDYVVDYAYAAKVQAAAIAGQQMGKGAESLAHNEGSANKKAKERDANNLVQQAQVPAPATDFLAPAQPPTIALPTREVVGNKLIELATISRDEAVKVLESFGGAKKLSDVLEAHYSALLETINKAIAATKAA